jgi:exodeoxyribonuclease-3
MKIVSFNINSIRARPHQLIHLRDTINPDVIGIQETKVNDPEFPIEEIKEIGYHPEFWGQKGHYGVAILSKKSLNMFKKVLLEIRVMIKKDLYKLLLNGKEKKLPS